MAKRDSELLQIIEAQEGVDGAVLFGLPLIFSVESGAVLTACNAVEFAPLTRDRKRKVVEATKETSLKTSKIIT